MEIQRSQVCNTNQHYLYYPFSEYLNAQQELRIRSVELWGGAPHLLMDDVSALACRELRHQVEDHGLNIRVFSPEGMLYPYYICAWDPFSLKKGRAYYRTAIVAAKELGASVLLTRCCGGAWDEDPQKTFGRAVETYQELALIAQDQGIKLAIEPVFRTKAKIVNNLQGLKEILDAVAHPALFPALDMSVAFAEGESLCQWFLTFGDRICHIHLTDSTLQGDPVAWGDGCLSLSDSMNTLQDFGYKGTLGLQASNFRYFQSPRTADQKNVAALQPYLNHVNVEV